MDTLALTDRDGTYGAVKFVLRPARPPASAPSSASTSPSTMKGTFMVAGDH